MPLHSRNTWSRPLFLLCLAFLVGFGAVEARAANWEVLAGREIAVQHWGRQLLQTGTPAKRPLAVNPRPDPLNSFRDYEGGYNVRDKHYWASALFTGAGFYIIGIGFAFSYLVWLVLSCCCTCCPTRDQNRMRDLTPLYYWGPVLIMTVFAAMSIGGVISILVGKSKFNSEAQRIEDYLIQAAENTATDVHNVALVLSSTQQVLASMDVQEATTLASYAQQLESAANDVTSTVENNKATVDGVLNAVETLLLVVCVFQLVLTIMGVGAAVLKLPIILVALVISGWLFCTFAWGMGGIWYTGNTVLEDTCQAMSEYVAQPANTTLDNVLPCVDLSKSLQTLRQTRSTVDRLVTQINGFINAANAQVPNPSAAMPTVCVPYGGAPNYTPVVSCPTNSVPVSNLTQTLQRYRCTNPSPIACFAAGQFITDPLYNKFLPFIQAIENVTNTMPLMEKLATCQFVITTLDHLVKNDCSPAESYIRLIWIGFAIAAVAFILLTVLWHILSHRARVVFVVDRYFPEDENHPLRKEASLVPGMKFSIARRLSGGRVPVPDEAPLSDDEEGGLRSGERLSPHFAPPPPPRHWAEQKEHPPIGLASAPRPTSRDASEEQSSSEYSQSQVSRSTELTSKQSSWRTQGNERSFRENPLASQPSRPRVTLPSELYAREGHWYPPPT